jgi:hypothetical protein
VFTFVIATFRAAFPEFNDTARYPDAMITFWSSFATAQVNACRWGDQVQTGVFLYTAHGVTLAAQNQKAGVIGGTPGGQSGPISSKTVGSVTAAYDTTQAAEKDAGYWNLTSYGKQFFRLARIFGAGPIQL